MFIIAMIAIFAKYQLSSLQMITYLPHREINGKQIPLNVRCHVSWRISTLSKNENDIT